MDPGRGLRQEVLQQAELERTGRLEGEGNILMDAPAYNNSDQLVAAAGGPGTEDEREEARKQWRAASKAILPATEAAALASKPPALGRRANTAEETAAKIAETTHGMKIYTDGGVNRDG